MPVDGLRPATDWIFNHAPTHVRDVLIHRLNEIRSGQLGDAKFIGYDLYEYRIFYGQGYRIYFLKTAPHTHVLLCAGSKKTQKSDIRCARKLQTLFHALPEVQTVSVAQTIQCNLRENLDMYAYIASQIHQTSLTQMNAMGATLLQDMIAVWGFAKASRELKATIQKLHQVISHQAQLMPHQWLEMMRKPRMASWQRAVNE
jgi:putative addiction module killer protein